METLRKNLWVSRIDAPSRNTPLECWPLHKRHVRCCDVFKGRVFLPCSSFITAINDALKQRIVKRSDCSSCWRPSVRPPGCRFALLAAGRLIYRLLFPGTDTDRLFAFTAQTRPVSDNTPDRTATTFSVERFLFEPSWFCQGHPRVLSKFYRYAIKRQIARTRLTVNGTVVSEHVSALWGRRR